MSLTIPPVPPEAVTALAAALPQLATSSASWEPVYPARG